MRDTGYWFDVPRWTPSAHQIFHHRHMRRFARREQRTATGRSFRRVHENMHLRQRWRGKPGLPLVQQTFLGDGCHRNMRRRDINGVPMTKAQKAIALTVATLAMAGGAILATIQETPEGPGEAVGIKCDGGVGDGCVQCPDGTISTVCE